MSTPVPPLFDQDQADPRPSDPRPPAMGAARVLMAVIVVFTGVVLLGGLERLGDGGGVGAALDVATGIVWGIVAAGVIHNGRRMRLVAWGGLACQAMAAAAAILMPAVGVTDVTWHAWDDGGAAYWWVPTCLLIVTVWWMVVSDPRRLAAR